MMDDANRAYTLERRR